MKTKSVNSLIFVISAIVFCLQAVGYFAPAWFVQEVVYNHDIKGILADGRRFKLPYFQNSHQDSMDIPKFAEPSDYGDEDKMSTISNSNTPVKDVSSRRKRAVVKPAVTSEKLTPGTDCIGSDCPSISQISANGNGHFLLGKTEAPPKTSLSPVNMITSGSETNNKKQMRMPENKKSSLLYITAGLWYSRACITTTEPDSDGDGNNDMQWCTLYSRFDDNTLEKRMNIFELRLEATLGIVFSAMCLFISSTACCSHRHHGRRALSSLASLFISGAITAVPVVHIVIQHVQIHEKIVRPRKWMQLTKMMHRQHDLFDHYSVILCGVASLLSVLSAFIITIISCRSNSKPDNWYSLNRSVHEEKDSKHELPINWVHNSKITVPPVSEIKDETKEESESGYSEVKDDVKEEATSSVHDGGSIGNDCDTLEFDPKEMTTFDM
ncbi:uncharacterized protein LOC132750944 [Ruditapes philippinarum]|uniref:uncharacterized protein LOC132750944 n=1 Tax=Ruditapes philippinarum TaxID=129788 RepID=UPI00295B3001|nr:uncharacterized protein LOC132750944 [Ruditapes philippinarum]